VLLDPLIESFHELRVILIDGGAGNDKERPQQKVLDRLLTEFLARLREAGVEPEEVDFMLLTHIHSDHVGWNTRLENDGWVPTFSNAEVIVSDLEYGYGLVLTGEDVPGISAARARAGLGEPVRLPVSGTFADSIMPLRPNPGPPRQGRRVGSAAGHSLPAYARAQHRPCVDRAGKWW
jgi:glyoxylase-like metal-dependent hydrolase (beta-lactamase superfamily II)